MREWLPYVPLLRGQPLRSLFVGLAVATLAGMAAVGLAGLAGWFITMSALAGAQLITYFIYELPSAGVRAFALLRTTAGYGDKVMNHGATFHFLARLRAFFFEKALQLPAQRVAAFRSGELLGRVMSDVDLLDHVLLRVVIPTVSMALVMGAGVLVIALVSVPLALIVVVLLAMSAVVLPAAAARAGDRSGARLVQAHSALRSELVEALQGLREIASYRAERIVRERVQRYVHSAEAARRRLHRIAARDQAATVSVASSAVLASLGLGLWLVHRGELAPGLAVMICLLAVGLFDSIEGLPAAYAFLGRSREAAKRLNSLLVDSHVEGSRAASAPFPPHAPLKLEDVSFRYEGQTWSPIRGLSLTVPPGSWLTVTGRSGSGKSTLLRLVAREISASEGRTYFGPTPLEEIATAELHRHLVLVAQDSHIFSGTLRENLLMARPDATDDELDEVLSIVRLGEWVRSLEHGPSTWVGERGNRLSGGQRRRLAIARALLRQPDVLLLDEPTDGIDGDMAMQLLGGIRRHLPSSTVIVATHAPSLAQFGTQCLHLRP
jgi:ATP-binding cassette, subfamily C, bacterial CydC